MIEENIAGGKLVAAALALLRASRYGLMDSELVELLPAQRELPDGAVPSEINYKYQSNIDPNQSRINTQTVHSFLTF